MAPASVAGARDTLTTLQGPGQAPDREPRGSAVRGEEAVGWDRPRAAPFGVLSPLGAGPVSPQVPCVITVVLGSWGVISRALVLQSQGKENKAVPRRGVRDMSSSVFRVGDTERKGLSPLLFGQGTIFA